MNRPAINPPAPPLLPSEVLAQVAAALPSQCRQDVIIIGSLAAGCYFAEDGIRTLRTKDVDCMFSPHAKAVIAAQHVTEELFAANWTQRPGPQWTEAGTPSDPTDHLPMVRLRPPGGSEWFLELLGAPADGSSAQAFKQYHRISTSAGDYAICSFSFLGLTEVDPISMPQGLRIAQPSMMALANLLHHPEIKDELMSGTMQKRSNKDLGRVLALSQLTITRDRNRGVEEFEEWAPRIWAALQARFPVEAKALALRAGDGIRALLASPGDLREAALIAEAGLLSYIGVDSAGFAAIGRRFMAEVIEPLEALAR